MKDLFSELGIDVFTKQVTSEVTEVLPTNILPLDIALGVGGLPRGRMITLTGQYATGKSTLCTLLAALNQRVGGKTIIFDTEGAYEFFRMKQVGVDVERGDVAIVQHQVASDGLWPLTMEYVEKVIRSAIELAKPEDKLLIIWDTVSATPVQAEVIGNVDSDKLIGKHARVLSHIFRIQPAMLLKKRVTLLCVAQPKTDPLTGATEYLGSKPLRFHSSVIIDLSRYSKDEKKQIIKFYVSKNKVAVPYTKGQYTYYFQTGIDFISSLPKFVGKSTSHYVWNDKAVLRTQSLQLLLEKKEEIESWVTSQLYRKIPYKILLDERVNTADPQAIEINRVEENESADGHERNEAENSRV